MNPTKKLSPVVSTPVTLRVADIYPNPLNPRQVETAERAELAESLKAVGQLSRIWVRPSATQDGKYELVDGERRWWGAQSAGIESLDALVGDWSDEHVVVIAFTTGSQSRPLDPIAEARGLKWLKDRTGSSLRELGARLGISYMTVHHAISVIEGHPLIVEAVAKKGLSMRTAFELSVIESPEMVEAALKEVFAQVADGYPPMSKDAVQLMVKKRYGKPRPAPVLREDQVPFTAEQSMEVLPAGSSEPTPESGFVAYTRPIPSDLLKPEVASGPSIKFEDVAEGVKVYVGVDEAGKSVEMVKLSEALAAVQPDDRHIFKEDVARNASMPKPDRAAGEPPSRRVEEEAAERDRKKAEKIQRKRDKDTVAWLGELHAALDKAKFSEGFTLWTLIYDLQEKTVSAEEIMLVLRACDFQDVDPAMTPREQLNDVASMVSNHGLAALTVLLMVVPRARAEGPNSGFVKDWHEAIVNPPAPTPPEAYQAQDETPEETYLRNQQLAKQLPAKTIEEIDSLHINGRCPLEGIAEVLKLDQEVVRHVLMTRGSRDVEKEKVLRDGLDEAFEAAGIKTKKQRDHVAQLACKCTMDQVITVEQLEALAACLKRVADAKGKKEAKAAAVKEEV